MSTLTLNVTNPDALTHGVPTRYRFDRNGGSIGSQGTDWLMLDRDRRIQPRHCEIRWLEGSFCVIDRCNQTYINQSRQSLGEEAPARLRDGDQLRIGACRLQVRYQSGRPDMHSLEALFTPERNVLEALLASGVDSTSAMPKLPCAVDICEVFAPKLTHDPLVALDEQCQPASGQQHALQRLISGETS